jgi:AraC family transcriptional regulator of adaptative response / DNA-3-methyladenine glycosylase II
MLRLEPDGDPESTRAKLREIPGIGDWTADYIAMRCLGWPDAFPAGDLGVLKALKVTKPKEALALAEQWRPWRAYAVMHLWRGPKPESKDTR